MGGGAVRTIISEVKQKSALGKAVAVRIAGVLSTRTSSWDEVQVGNATH